MAGPEQRALNLKRRRQAALQYLRDVHSAKARENSASSSQESHTNTKKDNTPTAPGSRRTSPTPSTAGQVIQRTNNDKIYIHNKDPFSSASRKRKAVKNGEAQEGKPEDGHRSKKAKVASGYVPDTGKAYRGTMRQNPGPWQYGNPRALRNKSTYGTPKNRERVSKQDTKNLNRNVSRSKLPYGGTSRSTQTRPTQIEPNQSRPALGHSGIAKPEAIDVVAGPLKQANRGAPKRAEQFNTLDIRRGLLQESKRKAADNAGHIATKRSKIGPTTVPPARKAGGFMNSIQLPGYTAAPPTNIKHVQEFIKVPVGSKLRR